MELQMKKKNSDSISQLNIAIGIDDEYGTRVAQLSNELTGQSLSISHSENIIARIRIPRLPLKQGRYNLTIYSSVGGEVADWIQMRLHSM